MTTSGWWGTVLRPETLGTVDHFLLVQHVAERHRQIITDYVNKWHKRVQVTNYADPPYWLMYHHNAGSPVFAIIPQPANAWEWHWFWDSGDTIRLSFEKWKTAVWNFQFKLVGNEKRSLTSRRRVKRLYKQLTAEYHNVTQDSLEEFLHTCEYQWIADYKLQGDHARVIENGKDEETHRERNNAIEVI